MSSRLSRVLREIENGEQILVFSVSQHRNKLKKKQNSEMLSIKLRRRLSSPK